MQHWYAYLFIAALMWAVHVGALKVLGEKLPAAQITFIFYFFALLTTLVVLLIERQKIDTATLTANHKYILWLAVAGISIGLVDYFFVKGLAFGAPISIYSPLFSTVALSLIALIGIIFFAEVFTLSKAAGFALACLGFFLLVR